MKRSIFGVYQFDEVVGAVVLVCVALFVAALVNAGLLKDWFKPAFTLRIILPDSGVSGLAQGADVQVLGTRAGDVRRIVIQPNQRMHALARIDGEMSTFIRRDSQVVIRRQFGIAGPAFIDISRGNGPELDWNYAVISATTDVAPTDTIGKTVDDLRAKILPLLDEVKRAVVAFTAVATHAADPKGPLEQTLNSAAQIAQKVERGDGMVGRMVGDQKMAADLEASIANVRQLTKEIERTSKDPQIAQIIQKTNASLTSLQATLRVLAVSSPQIADNVTSTTDTLPATILQAQLTARQLELLLEQMRQSWLFGGGSSAPPPTTTRRAPSSEVRP